MLTYEEGCFYLLHVSFAVCCFLLCPVSFICSTWLSLSQVSYAGIQDVRKEGRSFMLLCRSKRSLRRNSPVDLSSVLHWPEANGNSVSGKVTGTTTSFLNDQDSSKSHWGGLDIRSFKDEKCNGKCPTEVIILITLIMRIATNICWVVTLFEALC